MNWLIFVVAIVTIYLLWDRATNKLKRDGQGWLFRNWVAGVISGSVAIVQTLLLVGDFGVATLFGWLLFGGVVFLSRQPLPDDETKAVLPPALSSPAGNAAYTNASTPGGPMAKFKSAQSEYASLDQNESSKKSIVHGDRLDVISFDYVDAEGEFSSRRVKVTMVGQWQFEGVDLEKHATRTFRHDRVVGDVTSELTGEVLAAKDWAADARQNSSSNQSQKVQDDEDEVIDDDDAAHIEICFTGFTKADKLRLEGMAYLADMQVRQSVTKGLTHLCMGKTAGPKKIDQAVEVGAELIDEAEFYALHASS